MNTLYTPPSADEIAALSYEDKVKATIRLDVFLLEQAQEWQTEQKLSDAKEAEYDLLKTAFEIQHAALIRDCAELKQSIGENKIALQSASVARTQLTGEKTYLGAFQTAEETVFDFDPDSMLDWAIKEAPTKLSSRLLKLDTTAVKSFLKDRYEAGEFQQLPECAAYQAIASKRLTGKVFTDKLALLPRPPKAKTVNVDIVHAPAVNTTEADVTIPMTINGEVVSVGVGDTLVIEQQKIIASTAEFVAQSIKFEELDRPPMTKAEKALHVLTTRELTEIPF